MVNDLPSQLDDIGHWIVEDKPGKVKRIIIRIITECLYLDILYLTFRKGYHLYHLHYAVSLTVEGKDDYL